jgi:hypothetical protein
MKITQIRLKEVLDFNYNMGYFTWKKPTGPNCNIGKIAGWKHRSGYRYISIDNITYPEHRLVFLYIEGYIPENTIDHINRIRDDNRWENLREVSVQCNNRNIGIKNNNRSGITGVRFNIREKKWKAQITINSNQIHLGTYNNKIDAIIARHRAEIEHEWKTCNTTSPAFLYLKEKGLINYETIH